MAPTKYLTPDANESFTSSVVPISLLIRNLKVLKAYQIFLERHGITGTLNLESRN